MGQLLIACIDTVDGSLKVDRKPGTGGATCHKTAARYSR